MENLIIGELLQVSAPNQYKVVRADGVSELEEEVQRLMSEGWECQGGISVTPSFLRQAMVRRPVTNADYEKSKGE